MSRISLVEYENSPDEVKREFDDQIEKHGRITNMKRTLLHSVPAFKAYMEWYTLREEIEQFLTEREADVFAHAISTGNDCLVCSTFFRRILIDNGEDPSNLSLGDREKVLVEYGRLLVKESNHISDELFARLQAFFTEKEIVLLTAFAGLMIATNLFNNALQVPLDDYLQKYKLNQSDK